MAGCYGNSAEDRHFEKMLHRHLDSEEELDLGKIDNVVIEGVDHKDAPNYSDAFVVSADYNGVEMTEDQLTDLLDNYSDFVHDMVLESIN